jgi:hypothetical protein
MKKFQSKSPLWPALSYHEFTSTGHLLHMGLQAIGKLKLLTPFEPQWANVPLWLTARGLTTGPIPYKTKIFSIHVDLIKHCVLLTNNAGEISQFKIISMSVAEFVKNLFTELKHIGIDAKINMMPQEIPNPIRFDKDTKKQDYNPDLANAWWRILMNSFRVIQIYHARFTGKSPPIGFMWGTFDLRDARYQVGVPVPTTGENAEYIRRNAMNEAQVEAGWWSGNPAYPRPAYYSFTYPQPKEIEKSRISPEKAHWDDTLKLFILDYDDIRREKKPDELLLSFFESTYKAGTKLAGWSEKLISSGKPV